MRLDDESRGGDESVTEDRLLLASLEAAADVMQANPTRAETEVWLGETVLDIEAGAERLGVSSEDVDVEVWDAAENGLWEFGEKLLSVHKEPMSGMLTYSYWIRVVQLPSGRRVCAHSGDTCDQPSSVSPAAQSRRRWTSASCNCSLSMQEPTLISRSRFAGTCYSRSTCSGRSRRDWEAGDPVPPRDRGRRNRRAGQKRERGWRRAGGYGNPPRGGRRLSDAAGKAKGAEGLRQLSYLIIRGPLVAH